MEYFKSYQQITLIPNKCIVNSRSECNTEVKFGKHTFQLPILPSNMKSVIDYDTCEFLAKNNMFYIMHRFETDQLKFIKFMHDKGYFTSISVGIDQDTIENLVKIKKEKLSIDYITIDVAHAWSDKTNNIIKMIKDKFPDTFLIVGNYAWSNAIMDCEDRLLPIDAYKIGVAQGRACTTYNQTGFGVPMWNSIYECSNDTKKPIISDGGIREFGDITKALVAGAKMVMCGELFAGYDQSAGNLIEENNKLYKEYFGSASQYNKNNNKHIEGRRILIEFKGSMLKMLQEAKESLQSAISYGGGKDLSILNARAIRCGVI